MRRSMEFPALAGSIPIPSTGPSAEPGHVPAAQHMDLQPAYERLKEEP